MFTCFDWLFFFDHGGIRHLEIKFPQTFDESLDHGGIRHLENCGEPSSLIWIDHGGIRHLEIYR